MEKFQDNFWLWGQTPGSHHLTVPELQGVNRMTPVEGCRHFGIPNCCRVVMSSLPPKPYDSEADALDSLKQVIWSITGSLDTKRNDNGFGDLEEVIRLAKQHPNMVGGVLDDFFNPDRVGYFQPERLAYMRQKMNDGTGRPMKLWVVVYEHELGWDIQKHLQECDIITFWTWSGKNLVNMEENFERLRKMAPDKKFYAGFYMWDYRNKIPLTIAQMEHQCANYLKWRKNGLIDGLILCSNCIADIGLETSPWTRDWLRSVADETR